jgi:hypothetical protein
VAADGGVMRVVRVGFGLVALMVGVVGLRSGAQQKGVAASPPMG